MIIDASVALKWFLDEEGRDKALDLIGREALVAPDFLLLECANTFSVKVRRGLMQAETAQRALVALEQRFGVRFLPSRTHMASALDLALALKRSAYDCLYLALAMESGDRVVTADEKFERAISASPEHARYIAKL